MKIATFADLYLAQLQDTHSSERQIIRALPKMVAAAAHPELSAAFKQHLEETKGHLERLDLILKDMGKAPSRKVCEATVGLIKEGEELIDDAPEGEVRDAGLICAAQKIEHYEIACYGCLRTWATLLGVTSDVKLLEKTLNEERKTNDALTALAISVVNADALA